MSVHVASYWCPTCNAQKRFERQGANHILHFLLSLFTAGLWIPIWILCAFSGAYHCKDCGHRFRSTFETVVLFVVGGVGLLIAAAIVIAVLNAK